MSSLYETKKIPFETIYLSPFVVDEHGQKMSKTKGNILDPLPLAEKYGMDALRMSLILQVPPNSTVRLGEAKISGTRNFANKIWNSARFVLSFEEAGVTKQNNDDLDFLEKLTLLEASVSALIDSFHLNEAAEKLYDFYWHEFCDKYIETTKIRRQETQETLLISLKRLLVLLHPFMPFITEEIWQKIPLKSGQNEPPRTGLLMEAPWPTVN